MFKVQLQGTQLVDAIKARAKWIDANIDNDVSALSRAPVNPWGMIFESMCNAAQPVRNKHRMDISTYNLAIEFISLPDSKEFIAIYAEHPFIEEYAQVWEEYAFLREYNHYME